MSSAKPWHAVEIRIWLEQLLLERFGLELALQVIDANEIRLTRAGSSRFISFETSSCDFGCSASNTLYTAWNAGEEGWDTALAAPLPAPGTANLPEKVIRKNENGYCIEYDVLGLTYWMLNRIEEIGSENVDEFGRFSGESSHAFKYGYIERPIVDEWLYIIAQVMQKTWPAETLKKNTFQVRVSHDVDSVSRYAFRTCSGLGRVMMGDILRRYSLKDALLAPWIRLQSRNKLHPADPANNFDWIMDVSDRHGLKSAFYFICGRTDKCRDADYDLDDRMVRELMRRVHSRGHEIGLHPSFNSYQSFQVISAEAEKLRQVALEEGIEQSEWGGRMHYLRWEHPTTLLAWDRAGLNYDSTLTFADHAGFRCGTCFEYPGFDPISQQPLKVRIRPLVVMEDTVTANRYMDLGLGNAALKKFISLKNACRAVDGSFTILWHNTQLMSAKERDLYESVLSS